MTTDQEITDPVLDKAPEQAQNWASILEKNTSPEEKVKEFIQFMQNKLSEGGILSFREFWEVRKACLVLFKENIPQKTRGELWRQYIDLSAEARRLKGILDEQSAFVCQQIDLAIQSLKGDLDSYEERLSQIPEINISIELSPIAEKKNEYGKKQKQLHLFNALAAKVNSLRKEATKTDMRVRSKNNMFKQLSECGDRIFPLRKELIKQVSQEFSDDISVFVKTYFEAGKKTSIPTHLLREEVKNLQSFAKQLTLNTQSFTDTRIALSSCWDLLKTWDKEQKKERVEQRQQQKQSYEEAFIKVKEFEQFCLGKTTLDFVLKAHEEALNHLKGLKGLGIFELRQLKDLLATYKRSFDEMQKEQKDAILRQEKELEFTRLSKIQKIREGIQELLESAEQVSAEDAQARRVYLEESLKQTALSKSEKMGLERFMKQLQDRLLEVKSKRILFLSNSGQEKYDELQAVLQEKKNRRQEIKTQLEMVRKTMGGSGFDFEKAMMYKELVESEREVLEKINLAIEELEEKIAQIEEG